MKRKRINHPGKTSLDGYDAYVVLGIVLDWIEEEETSNQPTSVESLLDLLREEGYCGCVDSSYGCKTCRGVPK